MKLLCLFGIHSWVCSRTEIQGSYLLQFFECARCEKESAYCGFIARELMEIDW